MQCAYDTMSAELKNVLAVIYNDNRAGVQSNHLLFLFPSLNIFLAMWKKYVELGGGDNT